MSSGHGYTAPIIKCESCGKKRPHQARQWCSACYFRWYRAGKKGLPPMTLAERKETYFEILEYEGSREMACKRLGINIKTGQRYERDRTATSKMVRQI